jgi:hypothetical protein
MQATQRKVIEGQTLFYVHPNSPQKNKEVIVTSIKGNRFFTCNGDRWDLNTWECLTDWPIKGTLYRSRQEYRQQADKS